MLPSSNIGGERRPRFPGSQLNGEKRVPYVVEGLAQCPSLLVAREYAMQIPAILVPKTGPLGEPYARFEEELTVWEKVSIELGLLTGDETAAALGNADIPITLEPKAESYPKQGVGILMHFRGIPTLFDALICAQAKKLFEELVVACVLDPRQDHDEPENVLKGFNCLPSVTDVISVENRLYPYLGAIVSGDYPDVSLLLPTSEQQEIITAKFQSHVPVYGLTTLSRARERTLSGNLIQMIAENRIPDPLFYRNGTGPLIQG